MLSFLREESASEQYAGGNNLVDAQTKEGPAVSDGGAGTVEEYLRNTTVHDERTIMFRQPPGPIEEAPVRAVFEKVRDLMHDGGFQFLIVDVTEADRPSAAARAMLARHGKLVAELKHVALFTGRNILLNVVAKFTLSPIYRSFSVHRTLEQAEEAIRRAAD